MIAVAQFRDGWLAIRGKGGVPMGRKKRVSAVQPLMLSVAEVAVHLGVCRQTVYNLIYDGSIPSVKFRGVRRISRSSLDEWLKQLESA